MHHGSFEPEFGGLDLADHGEDGRGNHCVLHHSFCLNYLISISLLFFVKVYIKLHSLKKFNGHLGDQKSVRVSIHINLTVS